MIYIFINIFFFKIFFYNIKINSIALKKDQNVLKKINVNHMLRICVENTIIL